MNREIKSTDKYTAPYTRGTPEYKKRQKQKFMSFFKEKWIELTTLAVAVLTLLVTLLQLLVK